MKVFEVITEVVSGKEIRKEVQYVTSKEDTLKSVVDHFTRHCIEYEKSLTGVREVLTIVQHIIITGEASMDYEAILNAAQAQQELRVKTNEELADLLLGIWADMDIMSPQSGVIDEAIDRLRGEGGQP